MKIQNSDDAPGGKIIRFSFVQNNKPEYPYITRLGFSSLTKPIPGTYILFSNLPGSRSGGQP